jgi:signal transduction histidine kinase
MRDMHDGTGGHLVAALAQVEQGDVNKTVLMATLQNALDDIRLMIDSLDPVDEDVVSVLAMLRSRLEPRLNYSGIRVDWKVRDVPAIPGFGPEKVLQLMHILHEAVTNILKHAEAKVITFRTGIVESDQQKKNIFIEIEDNGRGFADDFREGHSLDNMYYRAALIQARLELVNGRQGCMVRVLLPMSL